MSTLLFESFLVLAVLSWCVGAALFLQARRDYRGLPRRAWLSNPFELWDPVNYRGAGALRIRLALLAFVAFMACVGLGFVTALWKGNG